MKTAVGKVINLINTRLAAKEKALGVAPSGGQAATPPPGPTPPPEAINDLRANPATAEQFDEVFGPGAAAKALGR
jgi:hypothetical protein